MVEWRMVEPHPPPPASLPSNVSWISPYSVLRFPLRCTTAQQQQRRSACPPARSGDRINHRSWAQAYPTLILPGWRTKAASRGCGVDPRQINTAMSADNQAVRAHPSWETCREVHAHAQLRWIPFCRNDPLYSKVSVIVLTSSSLSTVQTRIRLSYEPLPTRIKLCTERSALAGKKAGRSNVAFNKTTGYWPLAALSGNWPRATTRTFDTQDHPRQHLGKVDLVSTPPKFSAKALKGTRGTRT